MRKLRHQEHVNRKHGIVCSWVCAAPVSCVTKMVPLGLSSISSWKAFRTAWPRFLVSYSMLYLFGGKQLIGDVEK